MSEFLKAAAIVMSGGAIVGAAVLAMLPDEPATSSAATFRLPNSTRPPCNRPLWPNTACDTWVLPHHDAEGLLASEPPRAATSHASTSSSGHTRRRTARAEKTENTKSREARADGASRSIPALRRSAAVTQGWGMNSWHQDAFRPAYAERQNKSQNWNQGWNQNWSQNWNQNWSQNWNQNKNRNRNRNWNTTGSFAYFAGPAR